MARAALLAGLASVVGRVSGLVRDVVFTAVFGAGATADAFNAAFRVPNLFRELLAEGTLSNVFVPIFAETGEREGWARAWSLANAMLGILLVILGVVTTLFLVFTDAFVYLVAAGFEGTPGKLELTAWLTRWLAPFLAGLSIASLFGGMLNVRGRFFLPALAPSFLNLFTIVACLVQGWWERVTGTPGITVVALASTLSGVATAAVQYPVLRTVGFRFRPRLGGDDKLKRVASFVGAALVSVVVVQFNHLVETQIASRFGDGPVSYMVLGFRLVQIPQSIFSGSVAVAALAGMSVLLARGDRAGARDSLGKAMEMNALLVIPSAVGLYVLADPLIRAFFERGEFTAADTAGTAGILEMYAVATFGICTYRVVLPAFFAIQDPYTPMRVSIGAMLAKLPVALGLVYALDLGIAGLPLSHAVTVTGEVAVLMALLARRLDGWSPGFWGQHLRILAASAGMGGVLLALRPWAEGPLLIGVVLVGAGVYGVLALAFGVRETRSVIVRILIKLRLYRGPPPPGMGPPPGAPGGPPGPRPPGAP
ncbi:murein biosynthesis integral membrane protein MurJ [Myxococcota bacterium]|nr:murein biosynthesis integral membrane protein MurJ [Myxococcota bacterium]